MNTENRMIFFAAASVIGIIVAWYFNIQYIQASENLSLIAFVQDMYVNSASASISNDLFVVVAVFLVWSFSEAKRLGMRHWWVYPVLTFGIAIAFAFPLLMYMREKAISKGQAN